MKRNRNTKYFFFVAVLFLAFQFSVAAGILSDQTLNNDLSYYKKTSKNLDSNDKLYILLRIKNKYGGSGVNTAPIENEIRSLKNPPSIKNNKTYIKPKTKPLADEQVLPQGIGKVNSISVSDTESETRIEIYASDSKRSNYYLLRDPDPTIMPKLVFDLYDVKDFMTKESRDFYPKEGIFSRIQAAQFETEPEYIVRVVAEFRTEKPYKIKKAADSWIISAEKPASMIKAPPAKEPPPLEQITAPAPAPVAEPAAKEMPAQQQGAQEVSSTYKIEQGDLLNISVYPAEELSRESLVQPDGKISFPLIGSVKAQGLTPDQLSESLQKNLSKFISNPQVNISVRQFSRRQVFITGEIRMPGGYPYKEKLRLLEFVSSCGGFGDDADRRKIKIYRGPPTKRQTLIVNVEEIIRSGDFSKDFLLEPGDIIEVEKGRRRIAVLGEAKSSGYYDYKDNMQLLELMSLAGGFSENAQITDVSIIRKFSNGTQKVTKVNLDKILSGKQSDVSLASGDTVYIPKKGAGSPNWWMNNVLPWLTLLSLILVIRTGI